MRHLIKIMGLALLLLAAGAPGRAAAQQASATVTVTNGGKDVGDDAAVTYWPAGQHDHYITTVASAGAAALPPGSYDIDIQFSDGEVRKEVWLNGQAISGTYTKTVELNVGIAQADVTVTNGGKDVGGDADVTYWPAGQRDHYLTTAVSGGGVTIPPGNYDIDIQFSNGDVHKEVWLNNQAVAGTYAKTVEIGTGIAQATVAVTNGGKDVGQDVGVTYYPAGQRKTYTTTAYSGGMVTVPPGNYDIDIQFNTGDVHKEIWLDNQAISGNFQKTVELGIPIANVTYTVTNGGQDTGTNAELSFYQMGQYDATISSGNSGVAHIMPQASYDIHVAFDEQLAHKDLWLYNQALAGTVVKSVELGLSLALPTVNVTQNGQSAGDQANVSYVDGAGNNLGSVASGQQTVIAAGSYDIEATMGNASAWLRTQNLAPGKDSLTIDLGAKPAAAAPVAAPSQLVVQPCTIEIYGVNFDFDKATLRPDAAPVLRQVLALFTGDAKFAGEIGGHTDNIGPLPYNMKLSAARAEAVKSWLVAQGIDSGRMTTAGYADTRPLAPNTTDANRFKNRRVEIRRDACTP